MVDVERILLERNVPIPLRDGTMTYANVWRPAGGGPVPAIMVRTPYTKEVEEINVFSEPRVAAARGFAIVSQDVRGRGYSEGEFDPYFQEGLDGYDSIEHVAGLDWCSGDVFMAGNSYVGATQWLAAVEAPPSLRAIAPGLTPDAYDEGWTFHSGVLELAFIHSWIAGIFGPQDRLWLDDVERSYGARDELIAFAPWCEPWFREEIGSPYWERCSIAARRDRVRDPRALDRRLARHVPRRDAPQLRRRLEPALAPRHRAVGARRLADAPGWRPQPRRRRLRRRIRALRARARVLLGGDRRRGPADGAGHRLHAGRAQVARARVVAAARCRARLDGDPGDGVRPRPREPAPEPGRADPQGQHGRRPGMGPVRPAAGRRPPRRVGRGARRAAGAPAGGPGAGQPGDRVDRGRQCRLGLHALRSRRRRRASQPVRGDRPGRGRRVRGNGRPGEHLRRAARGRRALPARRRGELPALGAARGVAPPDRRSGSTLDLTAAGDV